MKFKIANLVLALILIFIVGSAFSMPPQMGGGHVGQPGKGHLINWEIHAGNGYGHVKNNCISCD